MSDGEVTTYFRAWRLRPECPWYVVDQYLNESIRKKLLISSTKDKTKQFRAKRQ